MSISLDFQIEQASLMIIKFENEKVEEEKRIKLANRIKSQTTDWDWKYAESQINKNFKPFMKSNKYITSEILYDKHLKLLSRVRGERYEFYESKIHKNLSHIPKIQVSKTPINLINRFLEKTKRLYNYNNVKHKIAMKRDSSRTIKFDF